MPIERINKVEFNNSTLFLFWPNISKLSNNFFNNIQKNFELKEKIALDNNEITQQLFKAIDAIIDERLRTLPYDKTITATIVNTDSAKYGKYTVTTDTNITFFAYTDITQYKLGERVYVRIPENNYSKQKIITGRYVPEDQTATIQSLWKSEDDIVNLIKNQLGIQDQVQE